MNSFSKINIAIDGFSSCGKSTLAKELAKEIGYTYVDSGAMYRAITLYFLEQTIDIGNITAIIASLPHINIRMENNAERNIIWLNGKDVSNDIRNLDVANKVSEVAAIKEVRQFAVALQQAMGENGGVVMDGRDIGTVVFPNADLKIFMTASEDVRVQRRFLELRAAQPNITLEAVRENIRHRDYIDTTRVADPLVQAPDARLLDNTNMTKAAQLSLVMEWFDDVFRSS
jgi:cytidylate kinase